MESKRDPTVSGKPAAAAAIDLDDRKDSLTAQIINSPVWRKIGFQPIKYDQRRKQEMRDVLRMIELMKTYQVVDRFTPKEVAVPIDYINDIIKRLRNIEGTL